MKHKVVCIGAMLIDEIFYCHGKVLAGTSNPANIKRSAGGVMRNIVHQLVLLNIPVTFITVVGNDADGKWLKEKAREARIDMSTTVTANCDTGKYTAILNPDGSLFVAAAVNPAEAYLTIELLQQQEALLSSATIMLADTNLDRSVLVWLIAYCNQKGIRLFIEPVSVEKAKKLAGISLKGVYMLTPNEDELSSLSNKYTTKAMILDELFQQGLTYTWLRKGAMGSEMISSKSSYSLPAPDVQIKDITGAGDAALAAWIAADCIGKNERQCLVAAHAMAASVLQVEGAINTSIDPEKLLIAIKEYYPHEQ